MTTTLSTEKIPSESQINACMTQLMTTGRSSYGDTVQKYARLRLTDFTPVLEDWQTHAGLNPPIDRIAELIGLYNLTDEQGKRLLQLVQQYAKQSNSTAQLYLAYMHAKGQHIEQSLQKTVQIVSYLSKKGDWRASQFWAELILTSPAALREFLGSSNTADTQQWQKQHPTIDNIKFEQHCRRFYSAPAAHKFAVRSRLQLAQQQGSPTAAQRLAELVENGTLPRNAPAVQFQSLTAWLDTQLAQQHTARHTAPADEDGISILPDNIPLLFHKEEDEKPMWLKPAIYSGAFLVFIFFITLMMRMTMFATGGH